MASTNDAYYIRHPILSFKNMAYQPRGMQISKGRMWVLTGRTHCYSNLNPVALPLYQLCIPTANRFEPVKINKTTTICSSPFIIALNLVSIQSSSGLSMAYSILNCMKLTCRSCRNYCSNTFYLYQFHLNSVYTYVQSCFCCCLSGTRLSLS